MQRKHHTFLFILGIALFATSLSFAVLPTRAQAQERDTGYKLVISQKSATTGYGVAPFFMAILTYPLADAPIDGLQFHFIIDGQSYGINGGPVAFIGQSNGQATFEVNNFFDTKPIGQYGVSATYFIVSTQTTIQSNMLIHTVTKGDIGDLECFNESGLPSPGQTVTIHVQLGISTVDLDPHSATYTISFTGPISVSDTNLTLDSADNLTVKAPSLQGNYTFHCQFNGTSLYNIKQQPGQPFVVSLNRSVGAIRVYSNPSTIVIKNQPGTTPATLYIVVAGTPGLPTPTGTFLISCANGNFYGPYALGPGGSATITVHLLGNCLGGFGVSYAGDPTYARADAFFSLTNPPISTTAGNANATATPVPISTSTSVPGMPTQTPTTGGLAVGGVANSTPSAGTPSGNTGGGNLWLVAILALIALGGGVSGFWFLRRRAQPAGISVAIAPSTAFSELVEPTHSPSDGDSTQL
jgi:hypothetical protein